MTWDPVSAGASRGPRGKGGKQGRAAKGYRKVPEGVLVAVQAEALQRSGEKGAQVDIARRYGVSRDLVKRLTEEVRGIDPGQVAVLQKGLPGLLTVLSTGMASAAVTALEDGDMQGAMKATFWAKLAVEANRFAGAGAGEAGGTVQAFIEALHRAGGGTLTVQGPVQAIEAEAVPLPVDDTASHEDQTPMPD